MSRHGQTRTMATGPLTALETRTHMPHTTISRHGHKQKDDDDKATTTKIETRTHKLHAPRPRAPHQDIRVVDHELVKLPELRGLLPPVLLLWAEPHKDQERRQGERRVHVERRLEPEPRQELPRQEGSDLRPPPIRRFPRPARTCEFTGFGRGTTGYSGGRGFQQRKSIQTAERKYPSTWKHGRACRGYSEGERRTHFNGAARTN